MLQMFFLADTSQKVDNTCFAYSCIYSVQLILDRNSATLSSDNRVRPFFSSFVNKQIVGRALKLG